jgi:hypothetical protein
MTRDEKFRQAAWTYFGYGLVYWVGGLVLMQAGLGPSGLGRDGAAWLLVGALVVGLFPWLLARERGWFDRWLLSRRDFARLLTLLVALRAVGVARIAWAPRVEIVSVGGYAIPMRLGAAAFLLVTVAAAVMLARAAWSRDP